MIQTKGVFVGASSGGGAASSIVIGNPVTGGAAYAVLREDASQNLAASSSLLFGGANAGTGLYIVAGTTATNANRALSISQGWTDGTTGNIGIVGNFDMGATGTATGKLLSLQAGAAGTTEVFNVDYIGTTGIGAGSSALPGLYLSTDTTTGWYRRAANFWTFVNQTNPILDIGSNVWVYGSTQAIQWASSTSAVAGSVDLGFSRKAAGIASFDTTAAGNGLAALHLAERTAPSAPAANGVYIYAQDNGAGKTQLMALFNSGAAQQIAIEP